MGVRQLQGDLIAPPMPVESVPAWQAGLGDAGTAARRDGLDSNYVSGPPDSDAAPVQAASGAHPPDVADGGLRLPPRQLQVMQLLSEGNSVKEIARQLNLGVGTVKVHASLAYSALGARNRIEAIRRAAPLLKSPMV
jgi:DNA-binding NarL/FixJ family response regulator